MTARDLKIWLLQFACKQKFHDVLKDFSSKVTQGVGPVRIDEDIPPVLVALCAVHKIVVKEFDITKFPVAISICGDIYDYSPESIVTYKLFAKVMTGLKMLTLFELLGRGDKMVLQKLNEYFPRTGIDHPKADKKIAEKLSLAQMKFRKFFLNLIANRPQREVYLMAQYKQEYGKPFQEKVKEHIASFISCVERELPPTPIEQIANAEQCSELCSLLNNLRCPYVQNLLDILVQVDQLSESDVRELLQSVCLPDNSQRDADISNDSFHKLLNISSDNDTGHNIDSKATKSKTVSTDNGDLASMKVTVPRAKIYRMKTSIPLHNRSIRPARQNITNHLNTEPAISTDTLTNMAGPSHISTIETSTMKGQGQINQRVDDMEVTVNQNEAPPAATNENGCNNEAEYSDAVSPRTYSRNLVDDWLHPDDETKQSNKIESRDESDHSAASSPNSFHSCEPSPEQPQENESADSLQRQPISRRKRKLNSVVPDTESSSSQHTACHTPDLHRGFPVSVTTNVQSGSRHVSATELSTMSQKKFICDSQFKQAAVMPSPLPDLQRHLLPSEVKPCLVKLFRNRALEGWNISDRIEIFS